MSTNLKIMLLKFNDYVYEKPYRYVLFTNLGSQMPTFLARSQIGTSDANFGVSTWLFRAAVAVHHARTVDANTTQASHATSANPSRGHASRRSFAPWE